MFFLKKEHLKNVLSSLSDNYLLFVNYIALYCICLLPSVYYVLFNENSGFRYIFASIIYSLPFVFVLLLIRNKHIRIVCELLLFICSFIEIVMLVQYGNFLSAGNILAVFTTSFEEGFDFICNFWESLLYTIPLLFLFFIAVKSNICLIKTRLILLCLFISVSVMSLFIWVRTYKASQTITFYLNQNFYCRPPYNFGYQVYNIVKQQRVRCLMSESIDMKFGAKQLKQVSEREVYVLAIGESCRYSNLSLAGYYRKTTPNLDTLSNVYLFTDYFSTACLTMYSVPQILTRATPSDFACNYREKTIIQPFNECGFKTFVLSHKANLLSYEKYLTYDAFKHIVVDNDSRIPFLIDSLSCIYSKSFFVVQFLGSHSSYRNFEKQQNLFRPNPISDKVSWDDKDAMINAYDNTILFTDHVLSSIIKGIDRDSTVSAFLYVSDHGEDFRPGSGGHGGTAKPRIEEYHVPMVFWHSDKWAWYYSTKVNNMKKTLSLPINSDNVFYSVCDMANIHVDEKFMKDEWSVFSSRFRLHDRMLLLPDGANILHVDN